MKRIELWLIAAAAIVPRLVVLVHERGLILTAFTDKNDDFAQTFVHHGTFGFIPGEPSAYTQPLYGFFLVPVYWIFGRSWESAAPGGRSAERRSSSRRRPRFSSTRSVLG